MNTRRMNRLEELGRVDAEKAFTKKGARNLRDEKKRIVRELRKADGGKVRGKQKAQPTPRKPKAPRDQAQRRRMGGKSKSSKDLISNITGKKLTNKTAINKINKTKAKYAALKESANSSNPMRTDRVFRTGSVKYRRPESAIEFYGDKGSKKGLAEKAMNRRIEVLKNNMKDGGRALKPVKPSQKGLKKLPTKVRNKMGYMKKGGRVGMGKALRGGGCVR